MSRRHGSCAVEPIKELWGISFCLVKSVFADKTTSAMAAWQRLPHHELDAVSPGRHQQGLGGQADHQQAPPSHQAFAHAHFMSDKLNPTVRECYSVFCHVGSRCCIASA